MKALKLPLLIILALCFACAKSNSKKKKKSPKTLVQKAADSGKNNKDKKVCEQNPQIITNEQRLSSINAKLMAISDNKEPYTLYSKDYLNKKSKISEASCVDHLEYNKLKANMYSYIKDVFKSVTGKFKTERVYLEWLSGQDNREKRIHLNHFLYFFNRALEKVNKNCEPIDLTRVKDVEMTVSYSMNEETKLLEFMGFSLTQDYQSYCFPCQLEDNEFESGIIKK